MENYMMDDILALKVTMDEMFHDKWNIQKEKYIIDENLHDGWKFTQLGWKV